eukprot:2224381-Rhodomonas_salina.1
MASAASQSGLTRSARLVCGRSASTNPSETCSRTARVRVLAELPHVQPRLTHIQTSVCWKRGRYLVDDRLDRDQQLVLALLCPVLGHHRGLGPPAALGDHVQEAGVAVLVGEREQLGVELLPLVPALGGRPDHALGLVADLVARRDVACEPRDAARVDP